MKKIKNLLSIFRLAQRRPQVSMQNNQYRFAFTLAEVLITIGIIGVVAAMTLPTVINETRNKQHVVAFKKLYTNFSNAINLFKADEGCEGIDVATCIEGLGYGDNNCDAFAEVAQKMKYVAMADGGASTGS